MTSNATRTPQAVDLHIRHALTSREEHQPVEFGDDLAVSRREEVEEQARRNRGAAREVGESVRDRERRRESARPQPPAAG